MRWMLRGVARCGVEREWLKLVGHGVLRVVAEGSLGAAV